MQLGRMLATAAIVAMTCANGRAQSPAPVGTTGTTAMTAAGTFIDASTRAIGEVRARQTPHGVLLSIALTNATPGVHAVHLHQVGACEAPSFASAGDHVNRDGRQHGFMNPAGPHAGDLPNLDVPASRTLSVEYMVADATLEPGPRSLLDADGVAVVIHAGKDDYATDPSGGSGDRLACASITAARR
jgi:Cu-Zn family superoxide dismutase